MKSIKFWWNDSDKGKLKCLEKNLLQCHFSTTNPTQNETGLNLEFQGERLVTNCMSHGMARRWPLDRGQ
jgi:hypothetical protein